MRKVQLLIKQIFLRKDIHYSIPVVFKFQLNYKKSIFPCFIWYYYILQ